MAKDPNDQDPPEPQDPPEQDPPEQDPPEPPTRKPRKPALSADIVQSQFGPALKKLQDQVSGLEDKLAQAEERNKGYEERFKTLAKLPETTGKTGQAILQEIEDWLFGKPKDPPKA